ncbi:MAG: PilZ domain-containing protein [Planctomycetota bacterium]|jgi:c-di-GMP-binding flagellar brake protein YcgR
MAKTQTDLRQHCRFELSCKVEVFDDAGNMLTEGRTLNVSDGGMLLAAPTEVVPSQGSSISVTLHLPTAPESDDMRVITSQATIVRHQDIGRPGQQGVAMQFVQPVPLGLEHSFGHLKA